MLVRILISLLMEVQGEIAALDVYTMYTRLLAKLTMPHVFTDLYKYAETHCDHSPIIPLVANDII